MSRIGSRIIKVPETVTVTNNNGIIEVKGPKGTLTQMQVPAGLTIEVKDNTELSVRGISKEEVGEFAANVRKVRQPEPYKGKGIRYKDEHIIRKEGKKAA